MCRMHEPRQFMLSRIVPSDIWLIIQKYTTYIKYNILKHLLFEFLRLLGKEPKKNRFPFPLKIKIQSSKFGLSFT